jgi:hypothetical protein
VRLQSEGTAQHLRRDHAVAAALFGSVERLVGGLDQLVGVPPCEELGRADADSYRAPTPGKCQPSTPARLRLRARRHRTMRSRRNDRSRRRHARFTNTNAMVHRQQSASSPRSSRKGTCRAEGGSLGITAKYARLPSNTASSAFVHLPTSRSFHSAYDLQLAT